jgi:uncharacterized protein (TIRG00374 family)
VKRGEVTRKVLASLLIGGGCLWLAAREVAWAEVIEALRQFDHFYLWLAIAISFAIQLVRAWRWKIELSPLADISFGMTWKVVAIAYMMINVLPFRLGEPVRPVLMSWKSGLSISSIIGNWVFEKMMDSAILVLFLHWTLLVADLPAWVHGASSFSLASFGLLLVLVVGFWLKGESFYDRSLARILPRHAAAKVRHILIHARDGLRILPQPRLVAMVFALSLLLWSLPILSSWVLILGFGFDIPPSAAFVVFVFIGMAQLIPNPPAQVGLIQGACAAALLLYDVPKADALAFGLLLNMIQFLTLVLQGLVALPLADVGIGHLTREAVAQLPEHDCG